MNLLKYLKPDPFFRLAKISGMMTVDAAATIEISLAPAGGYAAHLSRSL